MMYFLWIRITLFVALINALILTTISVRECIKAAAIVIYNLHRFVIRDLVVEHKVDGLRHVLAILNAHPLESANNLIKQRQLTSLMAGALEVCDTVGLSHASFPIHPKGIQTRAREKHSQTFQSYRQLISSIHIPIV